MTLDSGRTRAVVGFARIGTAVLASWIVYLSWLPFRWDLDPGELIRRVEEGLQQPPGLSHLVLFAAFGACVALALPARGLRAVLSVGAVASLLVEAGQLAVESRHATVLDLITHVLGFACGAGLARWIGRTPAVASPVAQNGARVGSIVLPVGSAVLILALRWWGAGLGGFDLDFPLVVGNELDGSRPWQGEIDHVYVDDRLEVVDGRHSLCGEDGRPVGVVGRRTPLLRFDLAESLGATAGALKPVELGTLEGAGRAPRRSSDGVRFTGPGDGLCSSPLPALAGRVMLRSEFAVAAHCRTMSDNQFGPAVLVAQAEAPWRTNWRIGQRGADLVFRVRADGAGWNGQNFEARWEGVFATDAWQHLLVHYDQGHVALFVDGIQRGRRATIFDQAVVPLGRSRTGIPEWLLAFLPLCVAARVAVRRRGRVAAVPFVVVGCVAVVGVDYELADGVGIRWIEALAGAAVVGVVGLAQRPPADAGARVTSR